MEVFYTHPIPPTCFGHSGGHLQGDALQRIHTPKYYERFWNQCTDIKYEILKIIYGLKYILKIKIIKIFVVNMDI
jgi:hypothetical protein